MKPDHRHTLTGFITCCIVVIAAMAGLAMSTSPVAHAQPAAPHNTYLVTSSSNAAITTCAGAPNDCSLRGAVQLANASAGADTINIDPAVTAISLSSPITLTGGSISVFGNGQEVTNLKTTGNFPALVIASSSNMVADFWINANGNHAGTGQHGIVINSGVGNHIVHNSLSDLGGDGVLIQGGSGTNIDSNTIGVRTQGGTQFATCGYHNDQSGVRINGSAANLISGNTIGCNAIDGVGLSDAGATGNELSNNYIGIVNWGNRVPNTLSGVAVMNGAHDNLIGNSSTGNVIGASGGYGVYVSDSGTSGNHVQHNSIGVSGTLNISNTLDGVIIRANATDNVVFSNIIADNAGYGVLTQNGANNTIIAVNVIGIEMSGGAMLAGCAFNNGQGGIRISGSSGNDVYSNTVGCSGLDGISVAGVGASGNYVYGNHVGVTVWGGRVPNALAGIAVLSGAHDNWIGLANVGNIIGANGTWGVYIGTAGTTTNTVIMNSIGIFGTTNISNTYDGLIVTAGASANRVMSNTIAYNAGKGVVLTGAGTSRNVLQSNTIRLNGSAGVVIDGGANNNRIGDYGSRSYGNVIGANATDGIYIGGATTAFNAVLGNNIGTNSAGNAADPNLHTGITLDSGAHDNQIGEYTTERNVIAGNAWDGVLMINGVHDNYVWTNDIGTNRDFPIAASSGVNNGVPDRPTGGSGGSISLPNGGGVTIIGSYTNTIGGSIGATAVDNFIDYNIHTGIYLAGAAHHNVIGSNTVRANGDYGVLFDGANTAYNTITRTLIYYNGLDGIGERNSADLNVWTEVGINDNGGLGIDKSASNDGQNIVNAPYVFFDSINKVTGVVNGHGHATDGVFNITKVELYRVSPDPGGFGEGGVFLGSTTTDASGNWTITDPSPVAVRGCYTAFITEVHPFLLIPATSYEFSANTCRVFLPTVQR